MMSDVFMYFQIKVKIHSYPARTTPTTRLLTLIQGKCSGGKVGGKSATLQPTLDPLIVTVPRPERYCGRDRRLGIR